MNLVGLVYQAADLFSKLHILLIFQHISVFNFIQQVHFKFLIIVAYREFMATGIDGS